SGVGVVLYSPSDELYPFSYKVQFENTNNMVEYEALFLGMGMGEYMGIKSSRCQ
ncbi:hypothetical protein KI387_022233, partial [Taxus chinensis]